jgi:2,3,4,5-tetrahydropyridine-2-carboxylate N-succinyltransferase
MQVNHELESKIEALWEAVQQGKEVLDEEKNILSRVISLLNDGDLTVVTRPLTDQEPWQVSQWVKKAILLLFRFTPTHAQDQDGLWWDKIPLLQLSQETVLERGVRIVPGASVRQGVWLGKSVIVMPSFINIGAFIDERTMIDSGTTIGACAFIGKKCHISSNVTIGGVLEPVQANPVIIEDDVFVGAGSHVLEGAHIESGSILGAGVIITSSTKIINRASREVYVGRVPAGSVLVPGSYVCKESGLSIHCAVIIKNVDQHTRQKTQLNDLLRIS